MSTQDALIADVEPIVGSSAIKGHLDHPHSNALIEDGQFLLSGWVFGTESPVTAIDIVEGDTVLERIAHGQARPDVAAAFPDQPQAGTSGFRGAVQATAIRGTEVLVRATLDDGRHAPLATIRFRTSPLPRPKRPILMIKRSIAKDGDPSHWPVPPRELMEYNEDPATHLADGRSVYETMRENCAGAGVQLDEARRILEFGCANGRITRWFTRPDEREVWGCDIQGDKVFWALEHLSPPLRFLVNEPTAHLPFKDESFDFVCAISVFTHLKENHITWMLELVRLLAPGGALYVTVHDETAFAQPDASSVTATYFAGLESAGDLSEVRYAAINDYREGTLAQVYLSREYVDQLLPRDFGIERIFPRAWYRQTAYLITRRFDRERIPPDL